MNKNDRDQDSGKDWAERSKAMMAWAVRSADRGAVHVSTLSRAETGLACNCHCCGCGGAVQAVNAGRPGEYFAKAGALRMHFRHDGGQQDRDCRLSVARRVALQLMAQGASLDLPGPSRAYGVIGTSGRPYTGLAHGEREVLQVARTVWLDEQAAELQLADGRKILVKLTARTAIEGDGEFQAVISIDVDDPDVANWTADEILALVRLKPKWTCWDRHWDDARLEAGARADALDQAEQALDLLPADLSLPSGLTPAQRLETSLHWQLKQVLANGGIFSTPPYTSFEQRTMPDGRVLREDIAFPALTWRLSDVRLERRLGNIVPDVLCLATNLSSTSPPLEMIVEVAVTHHVDTSKRAKIAALGVLCVELDANILSRDLPRKLDALRDLVWSHERSKAWIHHPEIERLHAAASAVLDGKFRDQVALQQAREATEAQERAEAADRADRLRRTPSDALMREYVALTPQAEVTWSLPPATTADGWTAQDMEAELRSRGLGNMTAGPVKGIFDVLRHLHRLSSYRGRLGQERIARVTLEAVMDDHLLRPWAPVIALAVKAFELDTGDGSGTFEQRTSSLRASILDGQAMYARDARHDPIIAAVFPELATELAKPGGTLEYAKERSQHLKAQREQAVALERQRQVEQQALAAKVEEERKQAQADLAYALKTIHDYRTLAWADFDSTPSDVDAVLIRLAQSQPPYLNAMGDKARALAESALAFRQQGLTIRAWMESMRPTTAKQVWTMAALLRDGGLSTRGPSRD